MLIDLLKIILGYDFWIVVSGLLFITQENFGQIMLESAKAKAAAVIKTGLPQADTINVDTVNVDKGNKKTPPEEE